jgi:exopolysaccharide biosynthesis operon protein EpsL
LYDDNVLGIPNGANSTGAQLSDTTRVEEAGLIFSKRIDEQVLSGNINVAHNIYERQTELDNDSKNFLANWNWHVGNHVEGNVGVSYVQALTPYVYFHSAELNVRTQRREFFDGSWLLHPSWRLRGGISHNVLGYALTSQQPGDLNEDTAELGIDYLASSGSTIGVQFDHTRGAYPNLQQIDSLLVDNSYNQNEIKAKINWLASGKTQLLFLGGYVQRKYDYFQARDYSGINARLLANWQPTGEIKVTLSGWREIGAVDDLTTSYSLNQGVSIESTWDLTSKLQLDGLLKRESSDYSGASAFTSLLPSDRVDTFLTASLKLNYSVTRNFLLGALIYHKNQDSNIVGASHSNNGAGLSSRYEF